MSSCALGRTMSVATVSDRSDTSAEGRRAPHPKGVRQSGQHGRLRVVRGEAHDASLEWGRLLARRSGPTRTRRIRSSHRPRAHRIPAAGWEPAEPLTKPNAAVCGRQFGLVDDGQQGTGTSCGWLTRRRSPANAGDHRSRERERHCGRRVSPAASRIDASTRANQRSSGATTGYTGLGSTVILGAVARRWGSPLRVRAVQPARRRWSRLQRRCSTTCIVVERDDGRGSAGRDRARERRSSSTVGMAPWARGAACSSVGTDAR